MPSLWAREKVKGSAICKACLDAFNKDQFCYFCHQIYVGDETTTAADDKDWIGCDSCGGWVKSTLNFSLLTFFRSITFNVKMPMAPKSFPNTLSTSVPNADPAREPKESAESAI